MYICTYLYRVYNKLTIRGFVYYSKFVGKSQLMINISGAKRKLIKSSFIKIILKLDFCPQYNDSGFNFDMKTLNFHL